MANDAQARDTPRDVARDVWADCTHKMDGACISCIAAALASARSHGAKEERARITTMAAAFGNRTISGFKFADVIRSRGGSEQIASQKASESTSDAQTPTDQDEAAAEDLMNALGIEALAGRVHVAKYALARARAEEREAFVERLAAWRDLILREGAARGMDVSTEAKIADLMIGWVKRRGAPEELAFPKASERGQK